MKKKVYLKREQFTELYNVFVNKNYPDTWKKGYAERAHYSLGLFLAQYLCNGFNLADAARLQYNDYYFKLANEHSSSIARRLPIEVPMIPRL